MKKTIVLLVIVLIGAGLQAQDPGSLSKREQRKLLKEEKNRQAAEQAALYAKIVDQMVKDSTFILEADMLYDKYGNTLQVPSSINFVLVNTTYGVIQIGSDAYLGRNGVGGVTIDGSVFNYQYTHNQKKGTYSVSYILRSPVGTYDIHLSAQSSGWAEARISGNFSSGYLRYSGRLVHPSQSRVFQGTSY